MLGEEGKEIGFCRFISRARFGSGGDGFNWCFRIDKNRTSNTLAHSCNVHGLYPIAPLPFVRDGPVQLVCFPS